MFEFLWDLHQQHRIRDNEVQTRRVEGRAEAARRELQDLEARVESLVLVTKAMWMMLEEKFGVTQEELAAKVEEIDLLDGKRDGRAPPPMFACAKCGRKTRAWRARCMYCGTGIENARPVDGL